MYTLENLTIGTRIKDYELQEKLGEGGFGAVFRAYQATIGRDVAMKLILPTLANQPDFIRRFETEAQVIARLEHPYIVPMYDYWRDPDGAYLIMRWLKGGSLRESLKNGGLDLETCANILEQIASALTVAHRNNIIHRDMKPGNILLDEDGNAYLADFGIAKDLKNLDGSGTQPDAIVGSLDYISPEQARGEAVSGRTDIYSLGVVLYEMLTGEHPFMGISSVERLYKHINDPLPDMTILDASVQSAINEVIQKATAKNPSHRYAEVYEFASAFREASGLNRTPSNETPLIELLTLREQEVLGYLVGGLSNKEIAQKMTITVQTVKWYTNEIYRKLRVRSRVQAIARARDLNLLVNTREFGSDKSVFGTSHLPEPTNPYKGLRAFTTADERDFYGREELVQKLLKRMIATDKNDASFRFLAILGPSGSGKSSLVKAGLLPAILRGELRDSERWFIAEMIPSSRPLDELEVALTRLAGASLNIREQLERDEFGLVRLANMMLPNDNSELVLVIDQFEEVFTLVQHETQRIHFLKLLVATIQDPRSRIRVILTLRADFYDRPLHYPDFGELLRNRMETILPLTAQGLERAITEPARRVGMRFEEGLVSLMVSEMNYQTGALPLLQYALTELFEQRDGRVMTHVTYQKMGGAVGALAKRAETLYGELSPTAQDLTRQVFLRLVTLGEGTEDTRRRTPRSELLTISPVQDVIEEVLDTFVGYRLLALDNDPTTRIPTVEVAHEALLREWERLRAWLNDSRDDVRLQRQLAHASQAWRDANLDDSYLLTGTRLEQFEHWYHTATITLLPMERELIDTSMMLRNDKRQQDQERKAREISIEKQSIQRLRALVVVLAIAILGALILSGVTITQRNDALDARATSDANLNVSESLRLASEAQAILNLPNGNTEAAALLSIRALKTAYSPQAYAALVQAGDNLFIKKRFIGHIDIISSIVFSPDGKIILSGSIDKTVRLWDVATGETIRVFEGHTNGVNSVAFAPDGKTILSGSIDKTVRLWDVATGETLRVFEGHTNSVNSVAFAPDGKTILSGSIDKTVRLWDVATGETLRVFEGHTNSVNSVAFAPDGKMAISGSVDNTLLWDITNAKSKHIFGQNGKFSPSGQFVLTSFYTTFLLSDALTGRAVQMFTGNTDPIIRIALSRDEKIAVSISIDGSIILWDTETGKPIRTFNYDFAYIYDLAFSPDGKTVIMASGDNTLITWNVENTSPNRLIGHTDAVDGALALSDGRILSWSRDNTLRLWTADGEPLTVLQGHTDPVIGSLELSDGRILSWSNDNTLGLWTADGELLTVLQGHTNYVNGALALSDGRILSWSDDSTLRLWTTDGQPLTVLQGHTDRVNGALKLADGRILSWSFDNTLRLWTAEGESLAVLQGHTDGVWGALELADGRILSRSRDNILRLWTTDGEPLTVLQGHTDAISGALALADGRILSWSSDDTLRLWTAKGESLAVLQGHTDGVWGALELADGRILSWSFDNTLRLWTAEGKPLTVLQGHTDWIWDALELADGRILSWSNDSTLRLWDAQGQPLTILPGHIGSVYGALEIADGRILSWSYDNTLRLWYSNRQNFITYACTRVFRDFAPTERGVYNIGDNEPTCPQFDPNNGYVPLEYEEENVGGAF